MRDSETETFLHVIHAGVAHEFILGSCHDMVDDDIRRCAVEAVRSKYDPTESMVLKTTFDDFVIDRVYAEGRVDLYLRPKVPFGASC